MRAIVRIMLFAVLAAPIPASAEAANALSPPELSPAPHQRPNIVLVNIESLRAQQMGVYGYNKNTTPFLDSLFRQGVRFNNAITPAYLAFQTDAAILSGLYPSQNNMMTWLTPINEKLTLFPRILGFNGYRTAAFVSPGLGPNFKLDKNFDEYFIGKNPGNMAETKFSVAEWMARARSPFFVFWNVADARLPFMKPTEEFFKGDYNGPFLHQGKWDFANQTTAGVRENSSEAVKEPAFTEMKETDLRYLRAAYDTSIQYLDNQLRSFFASIRDKEFYSNTVFIITAEHGEDLKEHGFIFHRDLYDVNIRVPLALIGLPVKPGAIDEAVSSLDIMPTVMEIAGGVMPENIEGKSLVPLIKGKSLDRDVYTERPPFDEYAMRRGNWKYVMRNPAKKDNPAFVNTIEDHFMRKIAAGDIYAGDELYDLSADKLEQNNLVGKGFPAEAAMKSALKLFRAKMHRAQEYNMGMDKAFPRGGKLIPYP